MQFGHSLAEPCADARSHLAYPYGDSGQFGLKYFSNKEVRVDLSRFSGQVGPLVDASLIRRWRVLPQSNLAAGRFSSGIMEGNGLGYTLQLGDAQVDKVKLAELCRRYEVKELSLFGSAVRGEMRPGSDIDVMVEFDPEARIGILRFESLSEDLAVLVGRKVDLVT